MSWSRLPRRGLRTPLSRRRCFSHLLENLFEPPSLQVESCIVGADFGVGAVKQPAHHPHLRHFDEGSDENSNQFGTHCDSAFCQCMERLDPRSNAPGAGLSQPTGALMFTRAKAKSPKTGRRRLPTRLPISR